MLNACRLQCKKNQQKLQNHLNYPFFMFGAGFFEKRVLPRLDNSFDTDLFQAFLTVKIAIDKRKLNHESSYCIIY